MFAIFVWQLSDTPSGAALNLSQPLPLYDMGSLHYCDSTEGH